MWVGGDSWEVVACTPQHPQREQPILEMSGVLVEQGRVGVRAASSVLLVPAVSRRKMVDTRRWTSRMEDWKTGRLEDGLAAGRSAKKPKCRRAMVIMAMAMAMLLMDR